MLKLSVVGVVIIGLAVLYDKDKTIEYEEDNTPFGQLWHEHQQLP